MKPQITLITLIISLLSFSAVIISCGATAESRPKRDGTTLTEEPSSLTTRYSLLIKQLGADDWQTRDAAQRSLEDIGEPAEASLKQAAQGPDPEIRMRARLILKVIAVKKRVKFSEAILKEFPDLYRALTRLDAPGKFAILDEITIYDKTEIPNYQDKATNKDIATLIGEILMDGEKELSCHQKEIILAICGGTRYIRKEEKENGKETIVAVYWDTPVPEAVPHIMKLLKDGDARVRWGAVCTLGGLGAKEAVPEIVKLLKDEDDTIRRFAVEALERLGAQEVISEIVRFLEDADWTVRLTAAWALGKLGAREAIPEIMKLLKDEVAVVRGSAAGALGELDVQEAIPEITKLLKDEKWFVRKSAAETLGKLGAQKAIPKIAELLKDGDKKVRSWAAIVLVELGAKDKVSQEIIEDIKFILRRGGDAAQRAKGALKELGVSEEEIEKAKGK